MYRCWPVKCGILQKAKARYIPCAHVHSGMDDSKRDEMYNRLRKTEADVTSGRQAYMAIFASRSCIAELWPILLDCIVTCDSTVDMEALSDVIVACNSEAARHHGVKAVFHLFDTASAGNSVLKEISSVPGQCIKFLSATEGQSALCVDCAFPARNTYTLGRYMAKSCTGQRDTWNLQASKRDVSKLNPFKLKLNSRSFNPVTFT